MPNEPHDGQVYLNPRSGDDRIRSPAAPHNGQFAGSGSMASTWYCMDIQYPSIANRERNGRASDMADTALLDNSAVRRNWRERFLALSLAGQKVLPVGRVSTVHRHGVLFNDGAP